MVWILAETLGFVKCLFFINTEKIINRVARAETYATAINENGENGSETESIVPPFMAAELVMRSGG